jgi:adenylate cyclase
MTGDRLSSEEIRAQLERILGHRDFEASARVREFLRFIVEETLAGRGHRLKGYTIAIEVFGRSRDFDANLDPIVRIQAGRLRRALEHYYLLAGGDDDVVISVPKGGYVPTFRRGERPAVALSSVAGSVFETIPRLPLGTSLAVLPLRGMPADAENEVFADGLREDLCRELSRYQELVVIPCRTEMLPEGSSGDLGQLCRRLEARFLLGGSVRRSEEQAKVSAWLIDGPQGRQIWSQAYTCSLSPGQLMEAQEEIAQGVSAAIGSELGVISQHVAQKARRTAPASLSTYEALLCFYNYEVTLSPELERQCDAALSAAVEREPEYGPLWSALAVLKQNAYVTGQPGAEEPDGQAAEFAERGASLAPRSQLTRGVLARNHFLRKIRDAFLQELETALALNPGSPLLVGTAGYSLILAEDAERGRPLLDRAIAMNPCHPGWFNHGLFVDDYVKGAYESALRETLKPGFDIGFWGPLLRAAVLGQLGRAAEARAAVSELLKMVPDFPSHGLDLTHRPILSDSIVDALLDGLRKAGLRLKDA